MYIYIINTIDNSSQWATHYNILIYLMVCCGLRDRVLHALMSPDISGKRKSGQY